MVALGVLLTFGTAVFVAAEFSLVSLDKASVEQKVQANVRGAKQVLSALKQLSTQLSGAQVGITLTTILLGYTTQAALSVMLGDAFIGWGLATAGALAVGAAVAMLLVNLFSMLFGELVPKNLALADPLRTARLTVGFQMAFTWLFKPVISFLNGTANWILRLMGIEPKEELSAARSASELAALVKHSADEGALDDETADLFTRSILMGELTAADVMTDRGAVEFLPFTATVQDVIEAAADTGFSRFPILDEDGEGVVAIASLRKAIAIPPDRRADVPAASKSVSTDPPYVPEVSGLAPLLLELRGGVQMAVVLDEFGSTAGIVTLEDVVEELVGEVADEHDKKRKGIRRIAGRGYMVPGTLRPDELADQTGILVEHDGPYETLAGLVMDDLGRIPQVGDRVRSLDGQIEVVAMKGRRVTRLNVTAVEPADGQEDGSQGSGSQGGGAQ